VIKADLREASTRLYRLMIAVSVPGIVLAALWKGWSGALGFATGAVFSIVNFWFWHRLVRKVGEASEESAGKGSIVGFALRYFLFAGGLYATIHYFEASLPAALTGIFVAVAAVLLEALIELIYGTS
jgi:hypothetical protein